MALDVIERATEFALDRKCRSTTAIDLIGRRAQQTPRNRLVYGMTTCEITDLCDQLPKTNEIERLYGTTPTIIGLETCWQYRDHIRDSSPKLRVAGLYNSGTNLVKRSIQDNFPEFQPSDVSWGKHTPIKRRVDDDNSVLPIVVVRDPFRWMRSMCKANYDVSWLRVQGHCPNLVPVSKDWHARLRGTTFYQNLKTYSVKVETRDYVDEYKSLADLWTSYYDDYYHVGFPRLIVRYEDFLFHQEQVLNAIADCVNPKSVRVTNEVHPTKTSKPIKYTLSAAKDHGGPADFIPAVIRFGSAKGRYANMEDADLRYAAKALSPTLLENFNYLKAPKV